MAGKSFIVTVNAPNAPCTHTHTNVATAHAGWMGVRLDGSATPTQRWARTLANGDVAVALFNMGNGTGAAADITIAFADVNMVGSVSVFDIWQQQSAGSFTGSYTAKAVPFHGTAFLRLSAAA